MRILFVQESDWLARNPHQQHHLAENLSLRGHQVRVIDFEFVWRTQSAKGLYAGRQVWEGINKIHKRANITVVRPALVKIPWLDWVSLGVTHRSEILRQTREFQPHVIVGFGILNSYLAVRAARKNHTPFIYYWIDVLHTLVPAKPVWPLARTLERKTLRAADRVLVINETLRDYVIRMGANSDRTSVLGAGVDLCRFDNAIDGAPTRARYNIADEDVVLFFMGWLYEFSGLKEVAAELSRVDCPRLKVLVVGEGDAYAALEGIRDRNDLQGRFILAGQKPYEEIPGHIAAADICLLPAYRNEPTMQDIVPIKMYEYLAMGKPVLATPLPGVMREFRNGNGVIYVEKPQDVVERALELAGSGTLDELGLKARSFAEQRSWGRITDEFEGILGVTMKEKRHAVIS